MRFAMACQDSCSTQTTQHLTFNLPNYRQDVRFVFFNCAVNPTGPWPAGCVAQGVSPTVAVEDANTPLQARIVPTAAAGTVRLQWNSASVRPGLFARWGTDVASLTNRALQVTSTTYGAEDMCAAPATTTGFRDPGYIHSALLAGLPAGEKVYYVFGDGQATSPVHSLYVPPPPGAPGVTKLTVYADMGRGTYDDSFTWFHYGEASVNTTKYLQADLDAGAIHAIAHFGDLGYAQGFASVWDDWLRQLTPVASQVAYGINTGNHESDTPAKTFHPGMRPTFYPGRATEGGDSGGECSVPTLAQFQMPRPSYNAPWWSWDVGHVHVVAISTEYNFTTGSEQWQWLAADLAAVDRSVTPWVVFGAHRPMYISSTYNTGSMSDQVVAQLMRDHLEPLLHAHGVDLAVYGHNHAMQRYCAANGGKCLARSSPQHTVSPSGMAGTWAVYDHPPTTVHVLVGSAGAGFSNNQETDPVPAFVEVQDYWFGYINLEVANATHLFATFRDVTTGAIADKWAIFKAAPTPTTPGGSSGSNSGGSGGPLSPGEEGAFIAMGALVVVVFGVGFAMWYTGRCSGKGGKQDPDYERMEAREATGPRTVPPSPGLGNPGFMGSPAGAEMRAAHAQRHEHYGSTSHEV